MAKHTNDIPEITEASNNIPLGAPADLPDSVVTLLDSRTEPIYPYTDWRAVGEVKNGVFTPEWLKTAANKNANEFLGTTLRKTEAQLAESTVLVSTLSATPGGIGSATPLAYTQVKYADIKNAIAAHVSGSITVPQVPLVGLMVNGADVSIPSTKKINFRGGGTVTLSKDTSGNITITSPQPPAQKTISTNVPVESTSQVPATRAITGLVVSESGNQYTLKLVSQPIAAGTVADGNATTGLYVGNRDTKADANVSDPWLKLFDDSTLRKQVQLKAGPNTTVQHNAGVITISSAASPVSANQITGIKVGASSASSNTAVDNPYVNFFEDNAYRASFQIKAGANTTVRSDTAGAITITGKSDSEIKALINEAYIKSFVSTTFVTSQLGDYIKAIKVHTKGVVYPSVETLTRGTPEIKGGTGINLAVSGSVITISTADTSGGSVWNTSGSTYTPKTNTASTIVATAGKMNAAQGFFETSDERLKTIKSNISTDLTSNFVKSIRTVNFDWKSDPDNNNIGVIAQEVEDYFPELVHTNEDGYKSVDYSKLGVILFPVVKDLLSRVELLENKING